MRAGLIAEYESPELLLEGVLAMRRSGFVQMDAYTPYPIHGVVEALQLPRSRVPLYCLLGGIAGGTYGYLIQYWMNGFSYALNVGGRPLGSVPAFIPATFEATVLFAAFGAVLAFFGFSGLPEIASPVFGVEGFERATIDRYFLALDASDPAFDPDEARRILGDAGAVRVSWIPQDEGSEVHA